MKDKLIAELEKGIDADRAERTQHYFGIYGYKFCVVYAVVFYIKTEVKWITVFSSKLKGFWKVEQAE